MADFSKVIGLVRVAKIKNDAAPMDFLKALLVAIYEQDISTGKVLISSTEVGGTVTFAVPPGMNPEALFALVNEAIQWLESQDDPTDPVFPRRIKRGRFSFSKASI